MLLLAGAALGQDTPPREPGSRPKVAVLWFEDRTGDADSAHWRYGMWRICCRRLLGVGAIRTLGDSAVDYAYRRLGIDAGEHVTAREARSIAGLIDAERVVWGSYSRSADGWNVSWSMTGSTGDVAGPWSATSADWLELRDELTDRALEQMNVHPTAEERRELEFRETGSAIALDLLTRAFAAQLTERPLADVEAPLQSALVADPEYAAAHLGLASVAGTQGELRRAGQHVQRARTLRPGHAPGRIVAGTVAFLEHDLPRAKLHLEAALRLDPDAASAHQRLGEIARVEERHADAVAHFERAIDISPYVASFHANLALAQAHLHDRDAALVALAAGRRVDPDDTGFLQHAAETYRLLGDLPQAAECYERLVDITTRLGANPTFVARSRELAEQLRLALTPHAVVAQRPRTFTPNELDELLRRTLTDGELALAVHPFEGSPEIAEWAARLTEGTTTDLDKARRIFDALVRRIQTRGEGGTRTAREVHAAWDDPRQSFNCQEFAKLFLAMGRSVGLDAFYVHLETDYEQRVVYHDCAALFTGGEAFLVDPAYRWFGAPHRGFLVLDDAQAIAHQLFQGSGRDGGVARCRAARKLHPGFGWGQVAMARALLAAGDHASATAELVVAERIEPGRWDARMIAGHLAHARDDFEGAARAYREAIDKNPEYAPLHSLLADVLLAQQKPRAARTAYRAVLRHGPSSELREHATAMLRQIDADLRAARGR